MASDTKLHSRCTTLTYACYQTLRFYREGLGCQTTINNQPLLLPDHPRSRHLLQPVENSYRFTVEYRTKTRKQPKHSNNGNSKKKKTVTPKFLRMLSHCGAPPLNDDFHFKMYKSCPIYMWSDRQQHRYHT